MMHVMTVTSVAHHELEIRPFGSDTRGDAIGLINRYIAGWPYSRPVDEGLVEHWSSMGRVWQPGHLLVGYRGGAAVAFAHGERLRHRHFVHLLALEAGAAADGAALLGHIESRCVDEGVEMLIGPNFSAGSFYGGYVLALEPFHPHWATEATDAFVRAGMRISHAGVMLELGTGEAEGAEMGVTVPEGYEIVEARGKAEYGARTCRLVVKGSGSAGELGMCGGRIYDDLLDEAGGPIGQIGHVETQQGHRNKGLARAMVRMTAQRLRRWGATTVLIATGLDNARALRCYEHVGFERRFSFNEWSKVVG